MRGGDKSGGTSQDIRPNLGEPGFHGDLLSFKIVQDSINGPIRLEEGIERIVDDQSFQRLRYVKQLGLTNLVYPGANHSRFEHSLGSMFLAGEFAEHFSLPRRSELEIAALLHDIGHTPFSHSFEQYFKQKTGMSHEDAGLAIIRGETPFENSSIPALIEETGADLKFVTGILQKKPGSKAYSRIVSGPLDSDELDYVRRDAYYCGVSVGFVDYRRVINTVVLRKDQILAEEKGIPALENVSVARIQMYRTVYWHKTARIAQGMFQNALQLADPDIPNPFVLRDDELVSIMVQDRKAGELVKSILARKLFKVHGRYPYTEENFSKLKDLISRTDLKDHEYILDVIPPVDFVGSERVKSNISVLVGSEEMPAGKVSPLIRALEDTLENRTIVLSVSGLRADSLPASLDERKFRKAS